VQKVPVVLRHHQNPVAVGRVEEVGRDRVVRRAPGVGRELVLHLLHPIVLQHVGHGDADARVVLVVAKPPHLRRHAVQEKTPRGVPVELPDAKGLGHHVQQPVRLPVQLAAQFDVVVLIARRGVLVGKWSTLL